MEQKTRKLISDLKDRRFFVQWGVDFALVDFYLIVSPTQLSLDSIWNLAELNLKQHMFAFPLSLE